MLTIYGRKSSANVQKGHWICLEGNLEFKPINIGGKYGGHTSKEFKQINPNSTIPVLKDDDFITTILHEMVHVMQYATGKMKDLNNQGSTVYWRGYNYSNYEYRRQPWERQAYRMQEILLREWKKYVGSNKCCRCVSST